MKINWGTGIIIAFVLFISFILFFVLRATFNSDYEHELVSSDYYKDELLFQQEIDRLENTRAIKKEMTVNKTSEGIEITFPQRYKEKNIKGVLSLYRPSDQSLDKDYPFVLSNTYTLLIPDKKLVGGRWDIKLSWTANETEYLIKKSITY